MKVVHFKRKGARHTACGLLVKTTKHDTTIPYQATCNNCRRTKLYLTKYYRPPPEN